MDNRDHIPGPKISHWLDSPPILFFAIAAIAVFYLSTLVDGQNWSGDFSQYVHHAKNLVDGKHYLDTNYLLNSISFFVGPYAYPPIFPLLLTPAYWLAGLDMEAFKWVTNICFFISLWFMIRCLQPRLQINQLILLAPIALNPFIWSFRNHVLSDFTFTLFSYLTLYLMLRYFTREENTPYSLSKSLLHAAGIGLCCYLAYGTREIGIVLPLTFITYDIVCRRKISIAAVVVCTIFLLLAYIQAKLLSGTFIPERIQENLANLSHDQSAISISHTKWISLEPERIEERIVGYRYALQDFWPNLSGTAFSALLIPAKILFNLTSLLAVIGYVRCLIEKITVLEIFSAGYIAVLLLFGAPATMRYLIPLFPLFLYYALLAIQWLTRRGGKKATNIGIGCFVSTVLALSLVGMHLESYERFEKGVYHPETTELFDWIKTHTDPMDTIVFRKPRVLALYTGRISSAYPNPQVEIPDMMNRYFDAIEGDYYIDMDLGDWMLPLEHSEPPGERFRQVFRNTYFAVYQYLPAQSDEPSTIQEKMTLSNPRQGRTENGS